jgi:NhaB family Na+:H+ antiporter
MVWMALPYTISMTSIGLLAAYFLLDPATSFLYDAGIIQHHSPSSSGNPGGPSMH